MSILKESDRRFVDMERKIGFFILTALAGIALVIVVAGLRQDIFTAKDRIYFTSENGQGINEGMAVKLSGFKIGKITSLELDDKAHVKVAMAVSRKYMKWIKSDSAARLVKEGIIGDSIIEVVPGSSSATLLPADGTVPFEREKGISAMVEELKDELKPVIRDIREIIAYINDPKGNIKATLSNVKTLSDDLSVTGEKLNLLLKDADKAVAVNSVKVSGLLDNITSTVNNANRAITSTGKEIPPIMDKVNAGLENLRKTTEEIKKAVEKSAPSIPPLVQKGGETASGAKEIVDSLKKTWPISSFIQPPVQKTLDVDSYE